jgi:signal transduction histidine kinase
VLNLLDNAVKYTRTGGRVRVRMSLEDGVNRIFVRDEGPGIPEKERGRIFERFYRGMEAGVGKGAGLGLAIAKSIAQLHAGDVRLAQSSPEGSTFVAEIRVSIPAAG